MALLVVWERVSVDKPDGTSLILKRHEPLPDFVSDFIRSTLTMIGAVKDYAQAVETVQAAVDAEMAEEPPPPIYPPEVPPAPAPPPGPVEKPNASDNREAWEAYVVDREYLSQMEAEAMPSKAKLMALVAEREKV